MNLWKKVWRILTVSVVAALTIGVLTTTAVAEEDYGKVIVTGPSVAMSDEDYSFTVSNLVSGVFYDVSVSDRDGGTAEPWSSLGNQTETGSLNITIPAERITGGHRHLISVSERDSEQLPVYYTFFAYDRTVTPTVTISMDSTEVRTAEEVIVHIQAPVDTQAVRYWKDGSWAFGDYVDPETGASETRLSYDEPGQVMLIVEATAEPNYTAASEEAWSEISNVLIVTVTQEEEEIGGFTVTPLNDDLSALHRGDMLELKVEATNNEINFAEIGGYVAKGVVTNRAENSGELYLTSDKGTESSFVIRIPTHQLNYGNLPMDYLVSIRVCGVGYQWLEQKIPFTVTDGAAITFYANHGTGEMTSQGVARNEATPLRKNTFECKGQHFREWTTEGTDPVTYADEQSVMLAEDLTLYALWNPNTTHYALDIIDLTDPDHPVNGQGGIIRGTCYVNESTSNYSSIPIECNQGITKDGEGITHVYLTALSDAGYTFAGWYSAETLSQADSTLQIAGSEPLSTAIDYSFELADEGETKKICAVFCSTDDPVDPYDPYSPIISDGGSLGGDLYWSFNLYTWGGHLFISGTGGMSDLDGKDNQPWHAYRDRITYVGFDNGTLPGNLETISEAAFRDCSGLSEIFLPAGLTDIGANCFSGCTGMDDIHYGGTQEDWDRISISGTGNDLLKNLPIQCTDGVIGLPTEGSCGDNLTWTLTRDENNNGTLTISGNGDMYDYRRYGPWHLSNEDIRKVIIEDGVTGIGAYAFGYCCMSEISIPCSVTDIGTYAFYGCFNLTGIMIPEGVTRIEPYTFIYCASLSKVTIPSSGKSIGSGAFEECYGLKNVTIPEGVECLEGAVFLQCYGLRSLSLPHSLRRIIGRTVYKCDKIKDIYYNGTEDDWNQIIFEDANGEGSLKKMKNKNIIRFASFLDRGTCGENLTWTLDGDGVLMVYGSGAMNDYSSQTPAPWNGRRNKIKSVVIHNGVTGIGDYAFKGCANLKSVKLPAGLKTIGDAAFTGCKLSELTISYGIETAVWDFFYPGIDGRDHLYHLALPAGITKVGFAAFAWNPFPYDHPDFVLPSGLTAVAADAFSGTDARFVWIPETSGSIGENAFAGCESLKYVYIPQNCAIDKDCGALPASTVILGFGESPAESYADGNGNSFIGLEDPSVL